MADPLVSVILPTYNSRGSLRFALTSLLGQSHGTFEAWVIGDGCTDDSEETVASFRDGRLHWVGLAGNSGSQSTPNNEGLRRAQGTYVAHLGHDDLWFPWHLSALVRFIESAKLDFVHSLAALIGPDGVRSVSGPPSVGRSYQTDWIPPSSWLYRRSLVATVGDWRLPANLSKEPDLDFQSRIVEQGFQCGFCNDLTVAKFPSQWWRAYAPASPKPQARFLTDIINDPVRLQKDLLIEAATLAARSRQPLTRAGAALWGAAQAVWRGLLDGYGQDRWPLNRYHSWRYQRWRARKRRERGLQ